MVYCAVSGPGCPRPDSISGLFLNEEPINSSEIIQKNNHELSLESTNSSGEKVRIDISFKDGIAKISVNPQEIGLNKVSLRFEVCQ